MNVLVNNGKCFIVNTAGALFYEVEANCNGLPCPPYNNHKELNCIPATESHTCTLWRGTPNHWNCINIPCTICCYDTSCQTGWAPPLHIATQWLWLAIATPYICWKWGLMLVQIDSVLFTCYMALLKSLGNYQSGWMVLKGTLLLI